MEKVINTKIFGGLPWNLFFAIKPDFTDKKGNVFNCKTEKIRTDFKNCQGEDVFTIGTRLIIDDVEIDLINNTESGDDTITGIPWNYYETQNGQLKIYPRAIAWYLEKQKDFLLPSWRKEQLEWFYEGKTNSKSINMVSDFLTSDAKTTDIKQHEEKVKVFIIQLKGIIPIGEIENSKEDEEDDYSNFFSFFVEQKVLKKVDDSHYEFLNFYTPDEFKYMQNIAKVRGLIEVTLPPSLLCKFIYRNARTKKTYKDTTWRARQKTINNGKKTPNFIKNIDL